MSSDDGAAADDIDSSALWSSLPRSLTLKFLALLPVEERARVRAHTTSISPCLRVLTCVRYPFRLRSAPACAARGATSWPIPWSGWC